MSEHAVIVYVYTPAGNKAGLPFPLIDGQLPKANDVDAAIKAAGYLLNHPDTKQEDVESILYICRYEHYDKRKEKLVPHIAFYTESDNLVKRWIHEYLDDDKVLEFERATGLRLADIPILEGDTHPERNNPKYQKYIVRLSCPIRIARTTYRNQKGETRHKLTGYLDHIGNAPTTTNKDSFDGAMAEHERQQSDSKPDNVIDGELLAITAHMYDHVNHQKASIQKMLDAGTITPDMSNLMKGCYVLMRRAHVDLFMDEADVQTALGQKLGEHLKQDGNSLVTAWNMIIKWQQAQTAQKAN